ncbi:MAG: hypothetical protein WCP03_02850, partial [Candidatus Saccharibacteria bacterium]
EAVVAERTNNTIKICTRLDKQGIQWKEQSIQIPASTGSAKSVGVGDINMDGIFDYIVSTEAGKQIKNGLIWLNGKSLTESKMAEWQNISEKHISKYDKVELIDLDKDGDLDMFSSTYFYKNIGTPSTPAWALQKNIIVIPKSDNKVHIDENANVYNFELNAKDMHKLDKFTENKPDSFLGF